MTEAENAWVELVKPLVKGHRLDFNQLEARFAARSESGVAAFVHSNETNCTYSLPTSMEVIGAMELTLFDLRADAFAPHTTRKNRYVAVFS
jgi:hypothetical protein